MCAPIHKGCWSWKYQRCIKCNTTKTKHKGKGMCMKCFDKNRALKPKRKQQLKNQHDRWYERVKGTPEYKKYCREHVKEWQQIISPIKHKRNWEKRNLRLKFQKFIQGKYRKLKGQFISFRDDNGKLIQTPIKSSVHLESDNNTTIRDLQIFKQVLKEENEKIKLSSTSTTTLQK